MAAEIERRSWPRDTRYLVGDDGSIIGPRGVLKPHTRGRRYPQVKIRVNGVGRSFEVHRIVAETFHGPRPEQTMQVAHRDGDPQNNRPDNLRWATRAENEKDKILHGTDPSGERHGSARLTEDSVREIRAAHAAGSATHAELALRYGIAQQHVYQVVSRRRWSHVA